MYARNRISFIWKSTLVANSWMSLLKLFWRKYFISWNVRCIKIVWTYEFFYDAHRGYEDSWRNPCFFVHLLKYYYGILLLLIILLHKSFCVEDDHHNFYHKVKMIFSFAKSERYVFVWNSEWTVITLVRYCQYYSVYFELPFIFALSNSSNSELE